MSILNGIKILKDLDEKELQSLAMFCQERSVKTGELIFSEGDIANSMYLLKSGEIEVFKNNDSGETILGYIESEDIFGEMALFGKQSNRMAGARAVKDSKLIIMLDFSIKELLNKHPEVMDKVKKLIDKRNNENKKLLD